MSDDPAREWRFYIDDMIAFAEKVIAYSNGLELIGNRTKKANTHRRDAEVSQRKTKNQNVSWSATCLFPCLCAFSVPLRLCGRF